LANRKKNEIKKLENELKYLEELSNTSTYKEDTSLKQKLEITIKRLDKLYTEKTKGRQIRSRVKWIEEGEKNTAFFLGLEKTRQTKKAINELYDKNGKSTTDQNEIMEIEVDYYKKLYKSTNLYNDKLKKYIENTKVHNKLSNNEKQVFLSYSKIFYRIRRLNHRILELYLVSF
jgi:biopolymer transport protein ExbD